MKPLRYLVCIGVMTAVTACGPVDHTGSGTAYNDPISRTGNPPYYTVNGVRYKVLRSSNGFTQRGTASWYGKQFHGKLTANGERFDLNRFTAAHRSLPLPSYVEVTNLDNGQKVVVRINDRGPFHGNRVIDLSYAAARQLGFANKGTTEVAIKALPMDRDSQRSQTFIQVGAYKTETGATQLQRKLQPQLRSKNVEIVQADGWHRVHVGPFTDLAQINQALKIIQRNGIKGWFFVASR